MSKKNLLGTLVLACSLTLATSVLALNPQPEPPIPYHGYEIVLTHVSPNVWRWEIQRPSGGHPSPVLKSGTLRGTHLRAINRAHTAIDRLPSAPQGY